MRCQTYNISPLALLCPQPARPLPPTTFFQQWSSAPSGRSASCRKKAAVTECLAPGLKCVNRWE